MKIGRNKPCPCGSGKKYKKCCLNKKKPPESLLWHRLGNTYDKLQDQLLDYARKTFGDLAIPLAMDDFLLWPEEENPIDLIRDHMLLFIPWFLFEWEYDPFDADMELPAPIEQTVASAYLKEHGSRLDRLERRLIQATLDQPFSFYEVMNCRPGEGYRLKDILRGIETDVSERLGSENASPGDILLCRVAQIDEVAILTGCSSVLIPPEWKPDIIDLRDAMLGEDSQITADVVNEYDIEIRDLYLHIFTFSMTPPQPCNTDDETAEMTPDAIETPRRRQGLINASGTDVKGVDEKKANEAGNAIDRMIEAFGSKHLDTLYTDLAFRLRQRIDGNRQLSLQRGRGGIWAAAIIYAIAQLNFLFDPETEPCISPDDICEFFDTKKSTVSNKAGLIRKELDLYYGHPDVCSPDLVSSFSFHETPEGFIMPGSLIDTTISPPEFGAEYDASIEKKDLNNRRQPVKQIKTNSKPSKKKEECNLNQLGLFDDLQIGENKMDLKTLQDRPSWEWPEGAGKMLVSIFSDVQADASDRLLAVELASDFVVISDDLIEGLLSILCNGDESDELRRSAVISMGPALEYADTDGFDDIDDFDDGGISEGLFNKIQDSLRELYMDTGVPKEVRRRILEASVRAPQDWHPDAISTAYSGDDESWRLTAVFCMQFVHGFEDRILEALNSENEDILYEAVCAAGNWEVDAAWEYIAQLVVSEDIDKELLLAAIEAVPNIRSQEAGKVLGGLLDSDDEDIVGAVHEAISMAEMFVDLESEEDEFL